MAPRRPPELLFPPDTEADSGPSSMPAEAEGDDPGGHYAIQDDHPRTDPQPTGSAPTAESQQHAALGRRTPSHPAESQPRSLDRGAERHPTGVQEGSECERGAGNRDQGDGGNAVEWFGIRRGGVSRSGRGNGVSRPAKAAKLKSSRRSADSGPSLFDRLGDTDPKDRQPEPPAPAEELPAEVALPPPPEEIATSAADSTLAGPVTPMASGEKAKARDILAAIRILNQLDEEHRPATADERKVLARFGGFGPVALSLFPDPVTGKYKDGSWQALGEELRELLSPEDYDSAKRTTFNAFYTSPTVIRAMHEALGRIGAPSDATVLEPGCGIG